MAETVQHLFATPLIIDKSEHAHALNGALKPLILAKMQQDNGLELSNINGWHSPVDMVQWGGDAARALVGHVMAVVDRHTIDIGLKDGENPRHVWYPEMWANVSKTGALNGLHSHPGCYWSAVYYVDDGYEGQPANGQGGILQLQDPRMPTVRMRAPDLRVRQDDGSVENHLHDIFPEAGLLVIFPSWLAHQVTPYTGTGTRISIAINLTDMPAAMAR